MRLLIISGEGNTLQSAAALATACYAAQTGLRVLLASAGPTHRIGELMGQKLGTRPLEIDAHLAAMEACAVDELGERWEELQPLFQSGVMGWLRDISSDELPSFPGMDTIAAMLIVDRAAKTKQFDLVVLDGPTTDNLLRAITLPDTLRWLVRLLFGIDRGTGRSRSSEASALLPVAILPSGTSAPLQDLRVVLEQYRERLYASSGTRVRLALTTEELDLPSLYQSLSGLGLYGAEVDTLLVHGNGRELNPKVVEVFTPRPNAFRPDLLLESIPVTQTERTGWAERGEQLYARRESGLALPEISEPETSQHACFLHIPFLDPHRLDIAVANEEVIVRIDQFRRHLLLPGLVGGGRLRAKVEGETLRLWVE